MSAPTPTDSAEEPYFLEHDPAMYEKALSTLIGQLIDPNEGSSFASDIIPRLNQISQSSLGTVALALTSALERPRSREQTLNALVALKAIGPVIGPPEPSVSVPALNKLTSSSDFTIALHALEALVKIDPPAAAVHMSLLLRWLRPGMEMRVRVSAIDTLGALGDLAEAALPELIKLSDEDDIRVSAAAISAISRIDPAQGAAIKRAARRGD